MICGAIHPAARVLRFCACALLFACVTLVPAIARAEDLAGDPEKLPARPATYVARGPTVTATFAYRDAIDAGILHKLASGLPTVVALRAYVFPRGGGEPVALAAQTCRVVYDLWDEVYRVHVAVPGDTDVARGERDLAVVGVEGVLRLCAESKDLPILPRAMLTPGRGYFVAALVEVNPVSREMLEQMRSWIKRPLGSTSIGTSDALFGSFVGLFLRQIGKADRSLAFRTPTFTSQ